MASTYRQVGFGSTGSAVSKLQTILNQHGYGLAVDGIFGEKTRAAVRDYQKRYNLKLDGIAGPETWGSLLGQNGSSSNGSYTGGGSSGKTSTSTNLPLGKVSDGTAAALDRLEKGYTPSSDVEAEQALLDSLAQLRPGDYESDFTAQLDALYQEISSRPGFSYDPGSDAAYQSYALQYARQGRAAMADTLGQTAHLTGGYGSSYAQSAAQQSYQRYLQQLSDVLPQLQSAAYSRYRDEGDALLDRYKLLQGQDEEAYGRWQDLVSAWQKEVSQAQSRYDQISSRDLKNYQLLLDYFADKAAAEQKGLHTSKTDESALSSIGNTASLSSTAAESLERAMNNYLKSGNAQQADTLLNQYKNRMTPAQKARFEALFAAWNRPLSW
jgi:peptidoglycan hydrolase-like protein with peptidoglycan-binding domain